MQITIEIPDNLPAAIVQQYLGEFKTKLKQLQEREEFKIDEQACLEALAKIKQGDKSHVTPIGNINDYIKSLKNEVS
jgi:hypothetical protein